MFASLTMLQRTWMLALLAAWAICLFGGFIAGRPETAGGRRMPRWTRLASSLTLVIASWSWFAFCRGTSAAAYALLLAAGMTLGFAGDLFLAHCLPCGKPIIGGMTAFGLGHAAYIAGVLAFGTQHALDTPLPRYLALAAWLGAGVLAWRLGVHVPGRRSLMRWAALPYVLLLTCTAGAYTGLALQNPSFWAAATGAALFVFSDLVLAAKLFRNAAFPMLDDLVWLTYGPGQMLIVYSAGLALSLARPAVGG